MTNGNTGAEQSPVPDQSDQQATPPASPVQPEQPIPPIEGKKSSKKWLWIIVVVIVIGLAAWGGTYLFSNNIIPEEIKTSGGKFPDQIADFERFRFWRGGVVSNTSNVERECDKHNGEVFCINTTKFIYMSGDQGVRIDFSEAYQGKDIMMDFLDEISKKKVARNVYQLAKDLSQQKENEIYWRSAEYDIINASFITNVQIDEDRGGFGSNRAKNIQLDNPVIRYYMDKYPPISVSK